MRWRGSGVKGTVVRSFLWSLFLAVSACACRAEPTPAAPPRPDIVLITVDTLRTDRVGRGGTLTPLAFPDTPLAADEVLG